MHWYVAVSYFFGGMFLGNAVPHLGNGFSGRPFQTPFAKPPGEGLSSSLINVLWGFFNLAVAWVLIFRVGVFNVRDLQDALLLGAGILVIAIVSALGFGRFHGGLVK